MYHPVVLPFIKYIDIKIFQKKKLFLRNFLKIYLFNF